MRHSGRGWLCATPNGMGVVTAFPEAGGGHRATPRRSSGGLRATLGGHPFALPFSFFFFLFFLFFFVVVVVLKNKFIYLFFNKFIFFFIQMDTCRHLIGLTWL